MQEVAIGVASKVSDHSIVTAEVIHQSGAPSTALRLSDGEATFAYSGDTEWTDALLPIAHDADLFICECYAHAGKLTGQATMRGSAVAKMAVAAKGSKSFSKAGKVSIKLKLTKDQADFAVDTIAECLTELQR